MSFKRTMDKAIRTVDAGKYGFSDILIKLRRDLETVKSKAERTRRYEDAYNDAEKYFREKIDALDEEKRRIDEEYAKVRRQMIDIASKDKVEYIKEGR